MIAAHQLAEDEERHRAVVAAGRGSGDVLLEALARRSDHWLAWNRATATDPFAVFGLPNPGLAEDLAAIAAELAIASAAGFELRFVNGLELLGSLESSLELARVLTDQPNIDLLHALSLPHPISEDALQLLVRSDRFASLRVLSLEGPLAGAIDRIAEAPWTQPIRALTVAGDFLRRDGARAIAASFPRLRRLVAKGVDAECLAILLDAPFVANLEFASFGGDRMTGVEGRLDDESVATIARAPWQSLRSLHLSGPNVGEPGARALLASETLADGISVSFLDVKLSDEIRAALEARFDVLLPSKNEEEN